MATKKNSDTDSLLDETGAETTVEATTETTAETATVEETTATATASGQESTVETTMGTTADSELKKPEAWGVEYGLKAWEVAGIMCFKRWKPGKVVSQEDFDAAQEQYRSRQMGGGRVKKKG